MKDKNSQQLWSRRAKRQWLSFPAGTDRQACVTYRTACVNKI